MCWHRWEKKWRNVSEYRYGGVARQQKTCQKCGKIKQRRIY